MLARHDPMEVAQSAGSGLLLALDDRLADAHDLARRLADDLRDRMWSGDDELAHELDVARGASDGPDLRPVPVDLEELAMNLEGNPMDEGWRLDIETGDWWPADPLGVSGEDPPEDWDDPDRWLGVHALGSREGWTDMRDFIGRVDDPDLVDRLDRAIHGRGAFRRFKDVLDDHDHDGILAEWFRFSDDRQRGRARAWLAMHGLRPAR